MRRYDRTKKARARRAATAIEYGLIASLIAVTIIGSLTLVGEGTHCTFMTVQMSIGWGSADIPERLQMISVFNAMSPSCGTASTDAGVTVFTITP